MAPLQVLTSYQSCLETRQPLFVLGVWIKALRGAGFGPQPGFFDLLRGGAGWIFYLLRGGAGCGPGYVKICGAGCGPNDTVAGRVRAQLSQPVQFL